MFDQKLETRRWKRWTTALVAFILLFQILKYINEPNRAKAMPFERVAEAFVNQRFICETYSADKIAISDQPIGCVEYIRSSGVEYWVGDDAIVHCQCRNPSGGYTQLFLYVRNSNPKKVTFVSLNPQDPKFDSLHGTP